MTFSPTSLPVSLPAFLPFTQPSIDEETIAEVCAVLRSGWITSGPKVQAFEAALSAYCAGRPVRVFNSGTATLEIGLRIAGIGAGDEVITTPLSWVATANVILEVGATPVFVDIDEHTRNIDLNKIAAAITPKTRAIIPVDLAGLPVDRATLYQIARAHNLRVIEDAAQALGARSNGMAIGAHGATLSSQGDLVSFSFHANKNLTTIEGGALVFNSEAEAKQAEKLRLQGVSRSGVDGMEVDVLGGKFNLTDVAAAIGLGQLKHLSAFTAKRKLLARAYFEQFTQQFSGQFETQTGCQLPLADFENSNWHMFQLVLPTHLTRADFITHMKQQSIGIGVHYPAIHLFALYRALGFKEGMFPIAERVGKSIVTLPLFPKMEVADVERVVQAIKKFYDN